MSELKRYGVVIKENGHTVYVRNDDGDVELFTREEADRKVTLLQELKQRTQIKTDATFTIVQLY